MNPLSISKKNSFKLSKSISKVSDKIVTTNSELKNEFSLLTNNKIEVITNGSSYYPHPILSILIENLYCHILDY